MEFMEIVNFGVCRDLPWFFYVCCIFCRNAWIPDVKMHHT